MRETKEYLRNRLLNETINCESIHYVSNEDEQEDKNYMKSLKICKKTNEDKTKTKSKNKINTDHEVKIAKNKE